MLLCPPSACAASIRARRTLAGIDMTPAKDIRLVKKPLTASLLPTPRPSILSSLLDPARHEHNGNPSS